MSFYLSARHRNPFRVVTPGEVYLALLLVSLCSCLGCHMIVRLLDGRLRDVFDADLLPIRQLLGWDQVKEQGVGFMDGGPHVCVCYPRRRSEGGAA